MNKKTLAILITSVLFMNPALAVPEAHEFTPISVFSNGMIQNTLKKEHPRLLANDNTFAQIKEQAKTDDVMKALVAEVIRRAENSLEKPVISYYLAGHDASPSLLDTSRNAIKIILDNSFAWKMTGDQRFSRKAIDTLTAISKFPDWNAKTRFLDTGEMMFAVALGYDWLYSELSPTEEIEIREALLNKGINWGLKAYADKDPSASSSGFPWWATNWNEVCNGGLLAATLVTAEHYPDQAKMLLNNIVPSLTMGLEAYKPDGASAEGPVYWSYGITYRILAQEMLNSSFGQDYGLSADPVLERTPWYRFAIEGFSGDGFNYGDAVEDQGYTPAYAWFGNRYKQNEITDAARGQLHQAVERSAAGKPWGEFDRFLSLFALWYPKSLGDNKTNLNSDFLFNGPASLFIKKQKFEDGSSIWLGVKSGDNNANHAHHDLGSFVLEYDGVRWANDLGKDYYKLPNYFDKNWRPHYYRVSALSHNTMTFDGDMQKIDGTATLNWDSKKSEVTVDLTNAYDDVAKKITRTYQVNGKKVKISDQIEDVKGFIGDKSYRWAMVTTADITLNGNTATLKKDGKTITVVKDDANATFKIESTKPNSDQEKDNAGTSMLTIQKDLPSKSDYTLNVVISD